MREDRIRPGAQRRATTNAILDAAEVLFSERGFAGTTVRNIAEEAGVTHPLVHRYLGTKDEIYRAVLRRNEDSIRRKGEGIDDLSIALSLMLRESLDHRRTYLRLIVNSAASGLPFESSIGRFPATELLIELAQKRASGASRETGLPPALVVALTVSLLLGWIAMEPWLLPATGLRDLDDKTLAAALERVMLGIVAQELPAAES